MEHSNVQLMCQSGYTLAVIAKLSQEQSRTSGVSVATPFIDNTTLHSSEPNPLPSRAMSSSSITCRYFRSRMLWCRLCCSVVILR